MEANAQMRREIEEIKKSLPDETGPESIEKWKRQHRRNHA